MRENENNQRDLYHFVDKLMEHIEPYAFCGSSNLLLKMYEKIIKRIPIPTIK